MQSYRRAWLALSEWQLPRDFQAQTHVSILIPARNEAARIGDCLQGLLEQDYPMDLVEILVIDDHSEDDTAARVLAFAAQHPQIRLLSLRDALADAPATTAFKKRAIEWGIQQASGALIVSTDADCQPISKQYLSLLVSFFQSNDLVFIAAPVLFAPAIGAFQRFQTLDFMGMMAITGAGIQQRALWMCNGANLAYTKAIFNEVHGFEGFTQQASGDDVFLLQKIAQRYPQRIGFLKQIEATMVTPPAASLPAFVQQRLRWASKSTSYTDRRMQASLLLVWSFHAALLFVAFSAAVWGWSGFALFLALWLIKNIADYRLLLPATHFFQRPRAIGSFFYASFLHWFYIVFIGLLANLKKDYTWKGRKTR